MSTTFPSADNLRIPPRPRSAPRQTAALSLPVQVAFSAVAGFGLAWILSYLIIG